MTLLLFALVLLALYFLPTLCALGKRNMAAVFALNLFLGWTCLGWVVALCWGLCRDPETPKLFVDNDGREFRPVAAPEMRVNMRDLMDETRRAAGQK